MKAKDQAEITWPLAFEAGLEQGRREVICAIEDYEGCYMDRRFFKSLYWKARLKEWGKLEHPEHQGMIPQPTNRDV